MSDRLSYEETATRLGVSVRTVYRRVRAGELPTVTVDGRRWVVMTNDMAPRTPRPLIDTTADTDRQVADPLSLLQTRIAELETDRDRWRDIADELSDTVAELNRTVQGQIVIIAQSEGRLKAPITAQEQQALTPPVEALEPQHRPWWRFWSGRSLWDWMHLLIMPALLSLGIFLLGHQLDVRERDIANDRAGDDVLESYFDQMSEFLLNNNLGTSEPSAAIRHLARVRTLTSLNRLDKDVTRKVIILKFLYDSGLIQNYDPDPKHWKHPGPIPSSGGRRPIVQIDGANLRGVDLTDTLLYAPSLAGVDLTGANLSGQVLSRFHMAVTDLSHADLSHANLSETGLRNADLSYANLTGADLTGADLTGADLSYANLSAAIVSDQQLASVHSLVNTTMPDGSKHN